MKVSPEVVISGISGRFPASDSLEELKFNLFAGVEMVTGGDARWPSGLFDLPPKNGKIKSIDKFDNEFFDISSYEAALTDPQERMLLELTYEAITDAGVDPKSLRGSNTGFFWGTCFVETHGDFDDANTMPEMSRTRMTRVSEHYEFKGPVMQVDTACGSSLSAFNEAILALKQGICDQAIVAGSNTIFRPRISLQFKDLKMTSKDGKSMCLDADANGYVRSEAAVVLLLQKQINSKRVYATVLNSKSNSDGFKVEGITFPSSASQARLCRETYEEVGINPADIGYIEAHLTGTAAGDPVEMNAVYDVICTKRKEPLLIGAMKSSIGHTEGASGLCALAKACIIMQSRVIPPNINFSTPNPNIRGLMDKKMIAVTKATPLPGDLIPVNCFGFGGSNTHVVLKGCFESRSTSAWSADALDGLPRLVTACGRTPEAVRYIYQKLESDPSLLSADFLSLLADYAACADEKMSFRGYSIVSLAKASSGAASKTLFEKVVPQEATAKPVWLVARCPAAIMENCGELLALTQFKETFEALQKPLEQFGINLVGLFSSNSLKPTRLEIFLKTVASQIAFVKLLKSMNFKPRGFVGYSAGELARAFGEGALTQEEAIMCAYYAGLYAHDAPQLEAEIGKVLQAKNHSQATAAVSSAQLARALCFPEQGINGTPKGSVVVEIGPNGLHERGEAPAGGSPMLNTLRTIGELYMNNVKLNVNKLYPEVTYPLPSTTPSLSNLIKWDHRTTWNLKPFLLQNATISYQTSQVVRFHFDKRVVEDSFLYDHKIDERPLFPATGYLMIAWVAFSKVKGFGVFDNPIEFRTVRYNRATVLSKTEETSFSIYINNDNGNFVIKEGDAVVVDGFMSIPELAIPEFAIEPQSADAITLPSKDVYKEFRVRGYDYGQYFQGISEAKSTGREGKIIWRDIMPKTLMETINFELEFEQTNLWLRSWIPFVDSIFQLDILKEENDTRCLFVPTRIESIICDPRILKANIESSPKFLDPLTMSESSMLTAHGRSDNIIWTKGLLVKGLKTTLLKRKQQYPRLYEYDLRPYSESSFLEGSDRELIDNYLRACLDAANGNVVEKGAFDLDDKQNALLRAIMLGAINHTDLSSDLLVGSSNEKLNAPWEVVYCEINTAVNNIEITSTSTPFDILEIGNTAIVYPLIREMWPDILIQDLLKLNYSLVHSAPESIENATKDGIKEIIPWTESNLTLLAPQNFIIFKCESESQAEKLIPQLYTTIKDGGFLLVIFQTAAPQLNRLLSVIQLNLETVDSHKLTALAEASGMTFIGEKKAYDGTLPHSHLLFRKSTKATLPENHSVIEIGVGDYEKWFEPVKAILREEDEARDKRVWVVAKADAYAPEAVTGVIGFVKSLRLETGGEKLRCLVDPTVDKVDILDPKYADVIKRDLIHNIFNGKSWGSLEPIRSLRDRVFHKETKHAYLRSLKPGDMSSLAWVESAVASAQIEASGQKMVDVYYSALNFRDIMFASGKLDSEAIPGIHPDVAQDSILGLEYTGIETSSNKRVMGICPYKGLATSVLVNKEDEDFIWPIPERWSMEEAATVPVVYATAFYALVLRGKLSHGESVLIHSGCGGVGLAAINICLSKGCTVYVTCGSEGKRKYLSDNFPQLVYPVNKIFNSRDISFEENILRNTDGRGVDVILNSLAEEKLQASLGCLAANGRFLEIGKVDFIQNNPLFSHQLGANQSFEGVLLDALFKYSTKTYLPPRLLEEKKMLKHLLLRGIEDGTVKPLDRTVFGKDQVEEAFRYMSTGKHIGKVLVKVKENREQSIDYSTRALKATHCSPSKSYVVLGGAGGLGLEVVQWLAQRGAKKLIICSRRGLREPYQHYAVTRLQKKGVRVVISNADVTRESGVKELLETATAEGPVGGIINGAVIYKDSLYEDQTLEQFKEVCGPKAEATIYLDRLSRKMCPQLDFFVTFSSLSCGRGNAGQTNYAYANSMMDSVCMDRVSKGFPGTSIQWGVIGDVGIVTETAASNEVTLLGTTAQRMHCCLDALDKCIQSTSPICLSFVKANQTDGDSSRDTVDILNVVTRLLGLKDISNLDASTTFGALGMDSLIAVEIKQVLERATAAPLSVKEIREFTIANLMQLAQAQYASSTQPAPPTS